PVPFCGFRSKCGRGVVRLFCRLRARWIEQKFGLLIFLLSKRQGVSELWSEAPERRWLAANVYTPLIQTVENITKEPCGPLPRACGSVHCGDGEDPESPLLGASPHSLPTLPPPFPFLP